ncbi:hypothetical protein NIES4072_26600 [Nostoc commune NIES-4072]|uniref:Uncharacterized protein n=1 Tax=Nostoc commune NIES-4072 TaxID=2005467 RepID=A0A2R5FL51_NOSCO|nr:hypothetical protein NIES4070_00260 [Nostoc commune HK-02]GBG18995.1 hypothetical protein NIES4072_26600 [Nostoc commune NIES-4072]
MRFQPYTEMLRRALSLEENTVLKHPLSLIRSVCNDIVMNFLAYLLKK